MQEHLTKTTLPHAGPPPWLTRISTILGGVFYPRACFACGAFAGLEAETEACGPCLTRLEYPAAGRPRAVPGATGTFAALRYSGLSGKLVRRFKLRDEPSLVPLIGKIIRQSIDSRGPFGPYDAVSPVPSHARKLFLARREAPVRLAEILAPLFNAPVKRLVRPAARVRKQTSLSRIQRFRNMRGAFAPCGNAGRYASVLLIDDVITTGATARACTEALCRAGVKRVAVFALAESP